MYRVVVKDWGNKNLSAGCLAKYVFSDVNRIAEALTQTPYTTPSLPSRKRAEDFAECVRRCGGRADLK
jgi:hypothetical protein